MPSGKRARQQRAEAAAALRTPPSVRSKGAGGRTRQASPRALAIAGGVVVVVIIAIVLGVVLSSGGSGGGVVSTSDISGLGTTGSAASPVALPGSPDANALFKGIPQKGLTLGNPNAPVHMEMFIDAAVPVLPRLRDQQPADDRHQVHPRRQGAAHAQAVGVPRLLSRSPAGSASSPRRTRTRASSTPRSSTTTRGPRRPAG